jgi:hypothetical protein
MHRCLQIPELVALVFSNVRETYAFDEEDTFSWQSTPIMALQRGDLNTFAALSRTCKAFCDLALDRLWEVQESLGFLLAVFPEFQLITTGKTVKVSRKLSPLLACLTDELAQRYHIKQLQKQISSPSEALVRYSCRIRSLYVTGHGVSINNDTRHWRH